MKLRQLPVFEMAGDEKELYQPFLELLTFELARLNLLCTVVDPDDLQDQQSLYTLISEYDVVFVAGKTDLPLQKITLFPVISEKTGSGLKCVVGNADSFGTFLELFLVRLREMNSRMPVWGCILVGGKSSRMGKPKHLMKDDSGKTWLERTIDILKPLVDGIIISGAGAVPESLSGMVRVEDIPGVAGPLSGILAASRRQPQVSWLLVACDMPHISKEAVDWLLSGRCPGCWGVVPRMPETGYFEPLFAWYDMRAGQLFERQLQEEVLRIGRVAVHQKIANPIIPQSLRDGWKN
ncbi:MAG: molybdenum cofactor guanylyltransferase, partial [Deltaproteobacteria bacterium]|nr:molybdenum cofactor guanylyltransferase [Deltaproteobacteria bacterium]